MVVLGNKYKVLLTKLEKTIILNLKGRISKILNVPSKLKKEEKDKLEFVFHAIDKLLLSKDENEKDSFQRLLQEVASSLEKSTKRYIKEHIVPLMNKISTNEWGRIDE